MNKQLLCNLLIDLHDSVDSNENPVLDDDQRDTVKNAALMIGGAEFWEHCSKSRVYDLVLENQLLGAELTDLLHFSYEEHAEEEKSIVSVIDNNETVGEE